jgi:hypothetical protein
MLFVRLDNLLDVPQVAIAPSALVKSQTPKWRDVAAANVGVVLLDHPLRIFITTDYDKVDAASD